MVLKCNFGFKTYKKKKTEMPFSPPRSGWAAWHGEKMAKPPRMPSGRPKITKIKAKAHYTAGGRVAIAIPAALMPGGTVRSPNPGDGEGFLPGYTRAALKPPGGTPFRAFNSRGRLQYSTCICIACEPSEQSDNLQPVNL